MHWKFGVFRRNAGEYCIDVSVGLVLDTSGWLAGIGVKLTGIRNALRTKLDAYIPRLVYRICELCK